MKCEHCPVPSGSACLGETGDRPVFCEWALKGERSALQLIVDRSALPLSPPPLLTRVVNFASAVVSHAAAGMPASSPGLKAARLAVCDGCDQRLTGGTCAGCGCDLGWKASWADQKCPLNKWPDKEL